MALINCPECEKEISDKAQSCIHCGCPIEIHTTNSNSSAKSKSNKRILKIVAIVCVICIGLVGLVKILDALIETQEEASMAAREAAQEYEEIQLKIESLKIEREKIYKRIDELNSKDKLTSLEQTELEELKSKRSDLTHEIALDEAIAKVKAQESNDAAVHALTFK